MLEDIQNDDPNEVMKEISNVKDEINEKLKNIKTDEESEQPSETIGRRRFGRRNDKVAYV